MNIGFYRYSFLNRGGDRVVVDYANALAEQGHLVTFHTCVVHTVFTFHPAVKINRLPFPNTLFFLLSSLWRGLDHDLLIFDIIHHAPLLGLRHRRKMVYFSQADDVEYYGNLWMRSMIDLLYRGFFKTHVPTITVSEALTKAFTKRYNATNCHTVSNGINLQTFYPDPDSELLKEKCSRKAIFFMARGDHYRKGFDIALKVLAKLDQSVNEKLELWVCGEAFNAELPFPKRHFGVVDDATLRRILSSADIFFYPSRHEGFGLFPLEAMACGCTVVTTEAVPYAAQTPAILTAKVNDQAALAGYLQMLVHDSQQHSKLREESLVAAHKYDMRVSSKRFAMVLEQLNRQTTGRGA